MTKPVSPRKDVYCPFFQKTLNKVCHTCALYVEIRQGDNPSVWDCSFALAPLFQLQGAKQVADGFSGLQAATESLRNETVRATEQATRVIAATALPRHNGNVIAIEDHS